MIFYLRTVGNIYLLKFTNQFARSTFLIHRDVFLCRLTKQYNCDTAKLVLILTMSAPNLSGSAGNAEDDELTLPRASINKMIKELVPSVRIANEARELVLACCTEFIHLLSSEANDICNKMHKKTINAEHIFMALDSLGFSDYHAAAESVLRDCKAVAAKRRRQSTRLENLGIPEEELLRQQQELFAKARQEQAYAEQQEWEQLQAAAQQALTTALPTTDDQDDYS